MATYRVKIAIFSTPVSFGNTAPLAPGVPFGSLRRIFTTKKLQSRGYPPLKTA